MTTENSSEPKVGRITFNPVGGSQPRQTAGPAFVGRVESVGGMTLRDWFAGMAIQGMVAGTLTAGRQTIAEFAASAYRIADAMLLERDKNAKK